MPGVPSEVLAAEAVSCLNRAMAALRDIWEEIGIPEEQRLERTDVVKKHIKVRRGREGAPGQGGGSPGPGRAPLLSHSLLALRLQPEPPSHPSPGPGQLGVSSPRSSFGAPEPGCEHGPRQSTGRCLRGLGAPRGITAPLPSPWSHQAPRAAAPSSVAAFAWPWEQFSSCGPVALPGL